MHHRRRGFTLMEMSGVLVIIGLVVGGIVTAQSFIRNAQLQSVLREYDTYLKAVQEFQDKYQALPGDFTGAQTIWGSLTVGQCDGGTAITSLPIPPSTATCNGNGDGKIGDSTTMEGTDNPIMEWWAAWQHLANAKLIDGTFTGGDYVAGENLYAFPGLNIPQSKYSGKAGWAMFYYRSPVLGPALWGDQYGNILIFGAMVTNNFNFGGILTPTDAYTLDQKVDDGWPGTGTIRTWRNTVIPNCIAGDGDGNQTTATYNTADANQDCSLIFIPGI